MSESSQENVLNEPLFCIMSNTFSTPSSTNDTARSGYRASFLWGGCLVENALKGEIPATEPAAAKAVSAALCLIKPRRDF